MTATRHTTSETQDPRIRLVGAALAAALDGSPASGRPDLFAPDFRFIGPARDLFPEPGSERLNGQLSQLQFDVRGIEDRDDGIVVSFNARARCHRVVADGEPVSADGVIVYHLNSGRIADAHGVLEWHHPSTIVD